MAYSATDELSSLKFDQIIGGALNAVVDAQNRAAMTTVNFIKTVGFTENKPTTVSFGYEKEVSPATSRYRVNIVAEGSGYNEDDDLTLKIGNIILNANVAIKDGKISDVSIVDTTNLVNTPNDTVIEVSGGSGTGASLKLEVISQPSLTQKMSLEIPLLTMIPIPNIRIANTDIEFNVKINSINTSIESSEHNSSFKNETSANYRGWWGLSAKTSFNTSIASQKKSTNSEEIKKEYSLSIKIHAVQDDMPPGIAKVLDILENNMNASPELK